nr:hypothetical protein [Tanacetum cinerariifolium]
MRILSVVRIKVFSMYGYDYMKKIVLRRADLNEHVITERDFKYLYPSDFEDMYMLNLQGYLNHLPLKDKKILTTDYIAIDSPKAIMFRDKYGVQMMMHFNEIHKFSDGTLQQNDEALDYRVKEFRINRMNPCLNTRFLTRKDVDRSKAFMFAIQKRLKTRRIFRNLESFTQLNLTKPQWDATGFKYKHDYTVIDSPRAAMFRDKYGVQIMTRFNEIHKFSDGTLQQIDEALDYRVKEFRINKMNLEAFEDNEDLPQPGELCWWTRQRGRLQTSKAYRMIKSFWHSRPLSDDL